VVPADALSSSPASDFDLPPMLRRPSRFKCFDLP
jgi:hypothetical protein